MCSLVLPTQWSHPCWLAKRPLTGPPAAPPAPLPVGYYSLLAASMGCRVVAWEPVPFFAAYLKFGLLRNNLTHLVEVRTPGWLWL